MGSAIGQTLPMAVVVGLSPIPIVAVILILVTERARVNGPAFVIGWVVGLAILGTVVLLLAVKQWKGRPHGDEEPKMPKWMATIDKTTPIMAVGLGAFLSGINPKNLIFNLSAGTSIAGAGASTGGEIVAMIVYALLATLSVGVPVIWYLADPESAGKALEKMRIWLVHNNAIVMAVLFLILGVNIIGKGISGLAS